MVISRPALGELLWRYRTAAGVRREDLAPIMGYVRRMSVSDLELGYRRGDIVRWACAFIYLGVSPEEAEAAARADGRLWAVGLAAMVAA